ncbi:MAG: acetate--CoA ligase family protein [Candidatus Calescibacterium sp.]|nr:acetate--CoA ligase family protein [Candidatus Calescibacterium sp.]MDW8194757.1 acetate--CoA ligase family protein [Candidatus Calescibacterium sp.]
MINKYFDIHTLLHPQSIAIVGISGKRDHISYSLLENIVDCGYQGVVYPVNPKLRAIKGIRCYPKITDIPDLVDVAIIILKPELTIEVLKESAKMGIKNFIIIASGFAEAGFPNYEQKLKEISDKYNLTLLGPNCVGIINTYHNLNASFALKGIPKQGRVSIISQSGGFSIGIVEYLTKMKRGISKLVSVGNKAVLQESNFLEYLAKDDTTKVIALYVEDIRNFEDFEKEAYNLLRLNKPIVVFKGGQTEEGSVASSSHTAALTETIDYYKALFNKTGCIFIDRIEEFYFILYAIEKNEDFLEERGKRVLIVSNCGGCAVINTDFAIKHGLEVSKISEEFKEDLRQILPPAAAINNPIDIVGDADHLRIEKTIHTVMKYKHEYDYLILNIQRQSTIKMEEVTKTIFNLSSKLKQEKILTLSCMFGLDITQKEYDYLHESNIPVFVYPENLTLTLKKITEYNFKRRLILSHKVDFSPSDMDIEWDELRRITLEGEKWEGFLCPSSVLKILKILNLNIPETVQISQSEFELNLEFPVVAKTGSPKIIHKTENKGIYLNITTIDELKEKIQELRKLDSRVIVQKMIPVDLELILGIRKSRKLNQTLIILGIGGIMVELLKTFQSALAPVDKFQIDQMLENLGLSKIFQNFRGKKYNKDQLIEVVNKLSELASRINEIEEIEVNPLALNSQGIFILDCRIKCYQ